MRARCVVIVGAGHAGFTLASTLQVRGFAGHVTLIGDEDWLPYQRPPLSKEFLEGKAGPDTVPFRPARFFADKEIELIRGDPVMAIDREHRGVALGSGRSIRYDELVIATGARSRALPLPGCDLKGVLMLRTLGEALELHEQLERSRRIVVIGGGFVGLEVAAAARARGLDVTVLEALDRILARAVSPTVSAHICAVHRAHGTDVRHAVTVARIAGDPTGRVTEVLSDAGDTFPADLVVIGVGAAPNTELAAASGLACDDGVVVDEYLATSDPFVWAIGDCAVIRVPGGRPRRLESVQNATDQGRAVAAAMVGQPERYAATPWFWTHQHECKLQIAGLVEGHDVSVLRGDPESGSFSVFCFAAGRLVGVESVNAPRDHLAARKLLESSASLTVTQAADASHPLSASV